MIKRVIASIVHDPCLYSSINLADEDYRGFLVQFLQSAINHQVVALDEAGHIRSLLVEQVSKIRNKWPEVGALAEESLRRKFSFSSSEQTRMITELVSPWLEDCTNPQQIGQLATLSLTGQCHVDGVVVSKETAIIADCAELPASERSKVRKLSGAGGLTLNDGEPLLGRSRVETEEKWFDPILKWGETVTLVDKQIGAAFKSRNNKWSNWKNFRLTIDWLYRCWSKHNLVPRRWFEVITHPARDETGRMDEPSTDIAASIWQDIGKHSNMRVTIVKEGDAARDKRGGGDVLHERYVNSMPMDFTLSVGRGFDLLKEGEGDIITQACTVSILSTHPQDLSVVLGLRKSGATYPEKQVRAL